MSTAGLFRLVAVVVAILVTAAVSRPHVSHAQEESRTITVDGVTRTYMLYVPTTLKPAAPVVFLLHGGGGSGRGMSKLADFAQTAEQFGTLLVFPDALNKQWNDGRGGDVRSTADDVGFLVALIAEVGRLYDIDAGRVFVAGISNGGSMTYRLACAAPEHFAAFASVSSATSSQLQAACPSAVPVRMLIMSGTDDPILPYAGGEVSVGQVDRGTIISAPETVAFWVERNGCQPAPTEIALPDTARRDGTRVYLTTYEQCAPSAVVHFYRIEGGGHTWPQGVPYLPARVIGRVSQDIDANAAIWTFFLGA